MKSLREKILSLPDDAIVIAGHGPATTIGDEARGNSVLKAWRVRAQGSSRSAQAPELVPERERAGRGAGEGLVLARCPARAAASGAGFGLGFGFGGGAAGGGPAAHSRQRCRACPRQPSPSRPRHVLRVVGGGVTRRRAHVDAGTAGAPASGVVAGVALTVFAGVLFVAAACRHHRRRSTASIVDEHAAAREEHPAAGRPTIGPIGLFSGLADRRAPTGWAGGGGTERAGDCCELGGGTERAGAAAGAPSARWPRAESGVEVAALFDITIMSPLCSLPGAELATGTPFLSSLALFAMAKAGCSRSLPSSRRPRQAPPRGARRPVSSSSAL